MLVKLMRMGRLIVLTTLCGLFVSGHVVAEVKVGEKIGELPKVKSSDGTTINWSDYDGKVLVFEWLNPDCPFVKRHYEEKTMHEIVSKLDQNEVVWLGVNSTHYMSAEATNKWKKSENISWNIISDQDGTFGKFFGAKTTPHMFVIGSDKTVIYDGAIDDDPYGKSVASKRKMHLGFLLSDAEAKTDPHSTKPYGCSVKYAS